MKIIYVGVFNVKGSTNIGQASTFEKIGNEVIRYDYRERARILDGKLTNHNPKRDKDLVNLCRLEKPDFILYSKCNQLHVNVVIECNKVCKSILWYMDFRNNINEELIQKIIHCDYVFSARLDGYEEGLKHNPNTYRVYEGFDASIHKPYDLEKTKDVCFIGTLRENRVKYHNAIPFDVVTNAFDEHHAMIVSQTKINLNMSESADGTSDRTFKVMAAGGFLLTEPWQNLNQEFEVGKDLDTFSSIDELKLKIDYYLNNEDERTKIAEHGRKTVSKYTVEVFCKNILEVVTND